MFNNADLKKKKTLDTNSNIPFKQIKRSKHLGPYLAGLIEGVGTIAVHDTISTTTKYRPIIIICFKKSDLPLANYLCDLTECGKVYIKPGRGYII